MSNQEFTLAIDHHLTNAERDALYEAGADDIAIQLRSDQTVIRFDREAPRSRARSPTSPAPA